MASPSLPSFEKIVVANRGEIAVRAFRAAYETGAQTVAVYPREDRNSFHRSFADEAVRIGTEGSPVKAYLDIDEIIRAAKQTGADAVYPGYGFLSENAELARKCAANGITFIGPSPETLDLTGDKSAAVEAARKAGLPILDDSAPSEDIDELVSFAEGRTYPLFVKAVAGGGGRGMRFVASPDELAEKAAEASREAAAAFGDGRVYIERAVINPQHIEVQILGDTQGNIIHLFERDCSLQRRHQKVVEIAPAQHISAELRDRICADAVKFCESINYYGAGTVEFLVDENENHVFIEMNPRIQVEHTVTEEVTSVDLVKSQMNILAGASLADLGLSQDSIELRGAALQTRITTEDPNNGFRPDTGVITAYRSPGGAGVRLDGAASLGGEITAHFDSMLVKMTCRGADFAQAVTRAQRALNEFTVSGVATNIGFLRALLREDDFQHHRISTSFIADHPWLLQAPPADDEAGRLLDYLADVTVNRPNGERPTDLVPHRKLPSVVPVKDATTAGEGLMAPPLPLGCRDRLLEVGPAEFARQLRAQEALAVTDTTFRDAHQSLLATRVRTTALVDAAEAVARLTPELLSVEAWGGATYDVALQFLHEDPWERLGQLREAMPNTNIQMLLRGRNTVGYTPYPDVVCRSFVAEAAKSGVDIFRIFDALNDIDQMRTAIDAVLETGTGVAEVAMAYAGDLSNPAEDLYTLDYYLKLAEQIVESGAHVLAIKDMAGLLRPQAASTLVTALRKNFDLPVHVHTHDTAGGQLATYLAAAQAGADAVDGASAAMAGTTSQPSLSAIVAAFAHTDRDTGISLDAVNSLEPYWEAVRTLYSPFESGLAGPTGRVYTHEIPGGQLSNLRTQATALGLGDRFELIEDAYAGVNKLLGRPTKVTPSSKVVGDLALHLVGAGVTVEEFAADPQKYDIPASVIAFLRGELGTPPGGWPEPLRTKALEGRASTASRVTEVPAEEEAHLNGESSDERRDALSRLLFPKESKGFAEHERQFGDVSVLTDRQFFYGLQEGEETAVRIKGNPPMVVRLDAVGEPDEKGMRQVVMNVNGQIRPMRVRDRSVESVTAAAEKADPAVAGHVAAPFAGAVTVTAKVGDEVEAGDAVAVIEAMKMEASITAPVAGKVARVVMTQPTKVEGGDLLVVVE
ncbi:pyruvate carboxylase [Corynebacterium variabile]|uniref:Pyruvate carboxylase n=9 Tax=Corynebacterium variabile TaxID=1727 RepID=A0A0X2NNL7_9CORY|nr:pyruvate carboxylase [Corynebacterium variabile]MDN6239853.1 pyruvate carboxylase [Corynebacterium variabile]MDN6476462.1 pyruvate carboxylase [Corynebacterium variabile]MDN6660579.1 pyruvate carboxylase [Corynebacterium variabile]MDN6812797.1 pyruvate carboxylase [Corynebacterium variabile]MDN6843177.1 pyruvate carboxylase [Corynebacterium variabile]